MKCFSSRPGAPNIPTVGEKEPCDVDDDEDCGSSGDDFFKSKSQSTKLITLGSATNKVSVVTSVSKSFILPGMAQSTPFSASLRNEVSDRLSSEQSPTTRHVTLSSPVQLTTRPTQVGTSRSHNVEHLQTPLTSSGREALDRTKSPSLNFETKLSSKSELKMSPNYEEVVAATELQSLTMNIALIVGIAVAVCILLCMLAFVLFRFNSRTGVRIAETKVFLPNSNGCAADKLLVLTNGSVPPPVSDSSGGGGASRGGNRNNGEVKEWYV